MGGAPPNPLPPRAILTYLLLPSSSLIIEELLDERASVTLPATQRPDNKLQCPVDGCLGVLKVGGTCGATSGIFIPRTRTLFRKRGGATHDAANNGGQKVFRLERIGGPLM